MGKLINSVLKDSISKEDFDLITKKAFQSNFTNWKSGVNEWRDINFKKIVDIEKYVKSDFKGSNCFVVSGKYTGLRFNISNC